MPEANPSPDSLPYTDASFAHWFESKRTPILVIALLFGLFWTILYLQFTVDDAYISFRYGKTLVRQHLWNWNPSGTREEAYTSAIYTVLGILPAMLRISPALFFKFVGLACIAVMVYRLRTAAATPYAVLLGFLLIAIDPWVWLHAYSGLETPLYMLLILEMALAAHRASTTSPAWVYTLFLLLPLTRPEGIVFACTGVVLFWYLRGYAPKRLSWFAAALALGLLYFAARWRYFHHAFPNPYYIKLSTPSLGGLRDSLIFNLTASKGYFLVLILVPLLARKLSTRCFALSGLLLLLLLFAPHVMQMNYADRFYFQVTFPILLFFLIAEDLTQIARTAVVLAAICLFATSTGFLRQELKYFPYLIQSDLDLGRKLAPFAQNHTLFTGDAGSIPYYSGWVTYDAFGLATYTIARNGTSLPLMQQLHPDLILIESEDPGPGLLQQLSSPGEGPAWNVPLEYIHQSGEYDYIGESDFQGEYLVEFLRRDTPQYSEIAGALRQNAETSARTRLSIKDLLLQKYVPWSQ
jgi:arabinofuranosyltransferase